MSSTRFEGVEKPSLNLPQGALSANQPKPNTQCHSGNFSKLSNQSEILFRCTLSALGLASSACVASPPCLSREVVDQTSRPEHWQRLKPPEELGDPPGVWTQTHTGLSTARKPPTRGKGNQMAPRSALLPFPWHKQAWSCQCRSH